MFISYPLKYFSSDVHQSQKLTRGTPGTCAPASHFNRDAPAWLNFHVILSLTAIQIHILKKHFLEAFVMKVEIVKISLSSF